MKITLPVGRYYKIDGKPSGRYSTAYSVEHMDFLYVGDVSCNAIGLGTDAIMAEFVPGTMVRSLSVGYSTDAVNGSLKIAGEANPSVIGFNLATSPIFVRGAEVDKLSIGFATTETFAALVRKTVLNDFDSMTLAEMDGFRLYDLSYITIE